MAEHPDINTLHAWLKRDQEAFRAQSHRLDEIQQAKAEDLSPADRNAVFNWDKSTIKECNKHLSIMEEIESPTAEEKQIMQELNKLVNLGDHIMERRNAVQAELEEKLGRVEVQPETRATHASASIPPSVEPSVGQPAKDMSPEPAPEAESHHGSQLDTEAGQEEIDPKELYQILGVEPDASSEVIKKAIKRQRVLMHPDRNPEDSNASARFADFQAAVKVFDTEESREEFDRTGHVRQIEDLGVRLRALTTGQ